LAMVLKFSTPVSRAVTTTRAVILPMRTRQRQKKVKNSLLRIVITSPYPSLDAVALR
jgi:hypothetical protein